MTLTHLLEKNFRERTLREKAKNALVSGRITEAEYAFFLKKELNTQVSLPDTHVEYAKKRTHREKRSATLTRLVVTFFILAIVSFALWNFGGNTPTGLVTLTPTIEVNQQSNMIFTQGSTIELNITNTSTLKITGTLTNGSGSVYLDLNGSQLLVYSGDSSPSVESVATEKESYALNESVDVIVTPTNAEYTLWLTDENGVKQPVFEPFSIEVPGAYTLDALVNDSGDVSKVSTTFLVRNDTNTSGDVMRELTTKKITFTDACTDTCAMENTGNATLTLEVVLSDGAVLNITSITTTEPRANHAPIKIVTVPNVTLEEGASTTLELNNYFTDPDDDSLTYDYMNVQNAQLSVNSNTLTITGTVAGTQQSIIYASDLYSITPSNTFTITVTVNNATNSTATGSGNETTVNTTQNVNETNTTTTLNETNTTNETVDVNATITNESVNTTTNVTVNTTTNTALNCSSTNPNEQSPDCLLLNASEYFPDQEILLQNLDRVPVARFTSIGNLLIGGRIIERSTASPGSRNFRIGYVDRDGNSVATIWIDEAGNLNLRGALHEENANLKPTAGAYSLINKRSVFLAYADQYTGDLYVRGNVIPYRFSGVSG